MSRVRAEPQSALQRGARCCVIPRRSRWSERRRPKSHRRTTREHERGRGEAEVWDLLELVVTEKANVPIRPLQRAASRACERRGGRGGGGGGVVVSSCELRLSVLYRVAVCERFRSVSAGCHEWCHEWCHEPHAASSGAHVACRGSCRVHFGVCTPTRRRTDHPVPPSCPHQPPTWTCA